ncbi:MAG: hypothetical protein WCR06_07565 [bacterium]
MKTVHAIGLAVSVCFAALGTELEIIRTNLEQQVGGKWRVEGSDDFSYVCPEQGNLPPGLDKGTYVVFVDRNGKTSREQALMWITQAPFRWLGISDHCTVLTYVSGTHPVSKAIVKALGLTRLEATDETVVPFFRPDDTAGARQEEYIRFDRKEALTIGVLLATLVTEIVLLFVLRVRSRRK